MHESTKISLATINGEHIDMLSKHTALLARGSKRVTVLFFQRWNNRHRMNHHERKWKKNIYITIEKKLDWLNVIHIIIEMMWPLEHESIYWINMKADIEKIMKSCLLHLNFQATQQKDKNLWNEIPGKAMGICQSWHFSINNKHYVCIVDYHSKFLVIEKVEVFRADNLKTCKINFSEYSLLGPIALDASTNFNSVKFHDFIIVSLSYNHYSNNKAEACIKFVRRTMKKVLWN